MSNHMSHLYFFVNALIVFNTVTALLLENIFMFFKYIFVNYIELLSDNNHCGYHTAELTAKMTEGV